MFKDSQISIFIWAVLASTLAGCQSPQTRPPSSYDTASDIVSYAGGPPALIFIPIPAISDFKTGYPAQIALPTHVMSTTNRIEVAVGGEVLSPRMIQVPKGTTALQAISYVGGFNELSNPRRLLIIKTSGQFVSLYLPSRRLTGSRFRKIWYESHLDSKASFSDDVSDYTLDAGDRIQVPGSGL